MHNLPWFLGIFLNLEEFSHSWPILYGPGSQFYDVPSLKTHFFPFPNNPFLPIQISFMHDGKRFQTQIIFSVPRM
jgi:hypothetical protein